MTQERIQIVVECEGGLVRNVYSSLTNVVVQVVDWDAAEGYGTHEQFQSDATASDPEYFAHLREAGVPRAARTDEERREYVALGLTVNRERTPRIMW